MAKLGNVKTASELLSALAAGAAKRPSADELFEQRVSFIYGSVGSKSNVTRDQIRKVLEAEGVDRRLERGRS